MVWSVVHLCIALMSSILCLLPIVSSSLCAVCRHSDAGHTDRLLSTMLKLRDDVIPHVLVAIQVCSARYDMPRSRVVLRLSVQSLPTT